MIFLDAYTKVNDLLKDWGEQGVDIAGETEKAFVFKGHVVQEDDLSGSCIIVDKESGDMRLFNAGRPEDRDVIYNAKQIEVSDYLKKEKPAHAVT